MGRVVWLGFSAYAGFLLFQYATERLFYGELVHLTGVRAFQVLLFTLAIGPAVRLLPRARMPKLLQRLRRDFGLIVFGLSVLHVAVYVERKGVVRTADEALGWELGTGWVAFVVFLALALTSNDVSVRLMKRGWKRLHRFVYLATALVLAHWYLTAFDPSAALAYAAITALVLGIVPLLRAGQRVFRR